jgi:hypothetical protein
MGSDCKFFEPLTGALMALALKKKGKAFTWFQKLLNLKSFLFVSAGLAACLVIFWEEKVEN